MKIKNIERKIKEKIKNSRSLLSQILATKLSNVFSWTFNLISFSAKRIYGYKKSKDSAACRWR